MAVLALVVEVARQLAMEEQQREQHSLALQALHHHQLVGDMLVVMLHPVILAEVAVVLVEQELPHHQGVMVVLVFNCIQTIAIQHPHPLQLVAV